MAKKKAIALPPVEYHFDHEFDPTGFPTCDKCKICEVYTATWGGLNSMAHEIYLSGSVSGVLYSTYCEERKKAIAHGIRSPDGLLIREDHFPLSRLTQKTNENKVRQAANATDIGIDSDISKQDGKKDAKKTKPRQRKASVRDLDIGELIYYGDKSGTPEKKREKGIVLDKNVTVKKSKSQKSDGSMALIKDSRTGDRLWVPENCIWVLTTDNEVPSDIANNLQLGFWSGDRDFSVAEALVPYIGIH